MSEQNHKVSEIFYVVVVPKQSLIDVRGVLIITSIWLSTSGDFRQTFTPNNKIFIIED